MEIHTLIKEKFSEYVVSIHAECGDQTVVLKKEGVIPVFTYLKNAPELGFDLLSDLTAVDYLGRTDLPRFEVVTHLYSIKHSHRLRVKVLVPEEDCSIPSISGLWKAADWYEREVWDMFGVRFEGHPNLKRLLMYEEFQGHALRKDYPVNKRQPLIGPVN